MLNYAASKTSQLTSFRDFSKANVREALEHLAVTVLYLAHNDKPMTDLGKLREQLYPYVGVNQVDWMGRSRMGHRFGRQLLACMDTLCWQQNIEDIRASIARGSAVGLQCDEVTDISVTTVLLYYWRVVDRDGSVRTLFGGARDLLGNKTANNIVQHLHEACADVAEALGMDRPLFMRYVATLGSDGCSTYTGRHNGVVAKLKKEIAHLIFVHCANHRLALCGKDGTTAVKWVDQHFVATLEALYVLYHYSSKKTARLREAQRQLLPVLGNREHHEALKIRGVAHTRWLSVDQVTGVVWKVYVALLSHLRLEDRDGDATARGLLMRMTSFRWLHMLCVFRDVMPQLTKVHKLLQTDNLDFERGVKAVDALTTMLEQAFQPGGICTVSTSHVAKASTTYREALEEYERTLDGEGEGNDLGDVDVEIDEQLSPDKHAKWVQEGKTWVAGIVDALKARFADKGVLSALSILFSASRVVKLYADEVSEEEKSAVKEELAQARAAIVRDLRSFLPRSGAGLEVEWGAFAVVVNRRFKNTSHEKRTSWHVARWFSRHYTSVNDEAPCILESFGRLSILLCCIPWSNATVERGASVVKLIKTAKRNRMSTSTMEEWMRVKATAPKLFPQKHPDHGAAREFCKRVVSMYIDNENKGRRGLDELERDLSVRAAYDARRAEEGQTRRALPLAVAPASTSATAEPADPQVVVLELEGHPLGGGMGRGGSESDDSLSVSDASLASVHVRVGKPIDVEASEQEEEVEEEKEEEEE